IFEHCEIEIIQSRASQVIPAGIAKLAEERDRKCGSQHPGGWVRMIGEGIGNDIRPIVSSAGQTVIARQARSKRLSGGRGIDAVYLPSFKQSCSPSRSVLSDRKLPQHRRGEPLGAIENRWALVIVEIVIVLRRTAGRSGNIRIVVDRF